MFSVIYHGIYCISAAIVSAVILNITAVLIIVISYVV